MPGDREPLTRRWICFIDDREGEGLALDSPGEFFRRTIVQRAVRTFLVVVAAPAFQFFPRVGEIEEDFCGHSSFRDKLDQGFVVTNLGSDRLLDKIYLRCLKSKFGFTGSLLYQYDNGKFTRDQEKLALPKAMNASRPFSKRIRVQARMHSKRWP